MRHASSCTCGMRRCGHAVCSLVPLRFVSLCPCDMRLRAHAACGVVPMQLTSSCPCSMGRHVDARGSVRTRHAAAVQPAWNRTNTACSSAATVACSFSTNCMHVSRC
eukprot:357999-Chlamydomonas_euryale.AAC.5